MLSLPLLPLLSLPLLLRMLSLPLLLLLRTLKLLKPRRSNFGAGSSPEIIRVTAVKRQARPAFFIFLIQFGRMSMCPSIIRRISLALIGLAAFIPGAFAALPSDILTIRFFQVTAEVAKSPVERARGLMGRTALPLNHGMLFIFEEPDRQCFWMRNTPLPLTIAFIDDEGRIVNFADMEPYSDEPHCSAKPVRFALEMERGWFKKRGVLTGDKVSGAALELQKP